jgi:hypothetical protein
MSVDEKASMDKMQAGMYMALEAAHELGGKLTITYEPPKEMLPPPAPVVPRLAQAKLDLQVFRMIMDGMTYTQVQLRCKLKSYLVAGHWMRVWNFLRDEIINNPEYKDAPLAILYSSGKRSEENLRTLRRQRQFLYAMIEKIGEEKFLELLTDSQKG